MNKYRRLFEPNQKIDVININAGSSVSHEITKAYICIGLAKEGRHFLTEGKFIFNGKKGRCDIADLSSGRCIEVVESESSESIEAKRKFYPLPVMAIPASDKFFR